MDLLTKEPRIKLHNILSTFPVDAQSRQRGILVRVFVMNGRPFAKTFSKGDVDFFGFGGDQAVDHETEFDGEFGEIREVERRIRFDGSGFIVLS